MIDWTGKFLNVSWRLAVCSPVICYSKCNRSLVFAEVTHAGRLFHRRGAATPKARSPAVVSRDLRITSLLDEADGSRVLELSSAAHCKSSAKYWGAVYPCRSLPSCVKLSVVGVQMRRRCDRANYTPRSESRHAGRLRRPLMNSGVFTVSAL